MEHINECENGFNGKKLLEVLRYEREHKIIGGIFELVSTTLVENATFGININEEIKFCNINTGFSLEKTLFAFSYFEGIKMVIEQAKVPLSEFFVESLHSTLSRKHCGFMDYCMDDGKLQDLSTETKAKIYAYISIYEDEGDKDLIDVLDFYVSLVSTYDLHDDGGRLSGLILFKECLRWDIVPFIITDEFKQSFRQGLAKWSTDPTNLLAVCEAAQNNFKKHLDYYKIDYSKVDYIN